MRSSEFEPLLQQNGFVLDHFAGVFARDTCPDELPINKFIIVNTE